jgi:hypothetical protein
MIFPQLFRVSASSERPVSSFTTQLTTFSQNPRAAISANYFGEHNFILFPQYHYV